VDYDKTIHNFCGIQFLLTAVFHVTIAITAVTFVVLFTWLLFKSSQQKLTTILTMGCLTNKAQMPFQADNSALNIAIVVIAAHLRPLNCSYSLLLILAVVINHQLLLQYVILLLETSTLLLLAKTYHDSIEACSTMHHLGLHIRGSKNRIIKKGLTFQDHLGRNMGKDLLVKACITTGFVEVQLKFTVFVDCRLISVVEVKGVIPKLLVAVIRPFLKAQFNKEKSFKIHPCKQERIKAK